MEQEQSILGFLKWLHYFYHQYKTETFLQARTSFIRQTRETNNSSNQCISAKPRDNFDWTGTILISQREAETYGCRKVAKFDNEIFSFDKIYFHSITKYFHSITYIFIR